MKKVFKAVKQKEKKRKTGKYELIPPG